MRRRLLGVLAPLLVLPATVHAQATPLTPDQVPAGVATVIAQRVTSDAYTYGGDCQQVTTDQSGDVCSLTTAQTDGTWSVNLYSVFTFEPLAEYAYYTFTVTPDRPRQLRRRHHRRRRRHRRPSCTNPKTAALSPTKARRSAIRKQGSRRRR